ncbi:DNA-3-methyladenine glycosylase family protein [Agromyces larvae]|uniref:DNA-3-methyladenine glycosylase 2 family protein n=1 Tax=Agromyces larvae TaxID=2929802 RepID=A0ABY4BW92_9MICO|nr:DNA-3-methyladenine glycosylase 2 family protein [Agromyces larvae]UOE43493.1 DNA-3-methyladenine glycosylase 2 family protein [Agromyces larvae]
MIADQRLDWQPRHPTDLHRTVGSLRRGPGDPAFHLDRDGAVWRATRTPEGVATVRLIQAGGGSIRAEAWGPGAGWAVAQAPELVGDADDTSDFDPIHDALRDAHRRNPGLRIPRTTLVFEALVPAILEQKVITLQAHESWRRLLLRFGEVAPGPTARPLRVPPPPSTWAVVPVWEWHRAGVDPRRAQTIATVARFAERVDEAARMSRADAVARLTHFPGVGEWTAAEVAQRALGDADALSIGDYHLSNQVGHALVGHDVTDDEMLALLEPWRGHRYRVVRLLGASGRLRRPRRGAKLPFVDHTWH